MSANSSKIVQTKQQQILALEEYLNIYKQRLVEVEVALNALNRAKDKGEQSAFQILGANILIKRSIDELIDELNQEKDILSKRIKGIEEQLIQLKKELRELTTKKSEE